MGCPRAGSVKYVRSADRFVDRSSSARPGGRWRMARIEHYEFGRIVVDGQEEQRDLIILPDRVVGNWWRRHGHALVPEDLDEVLDDLPEHLVIGTGAHGQMQPNQEPSSGCKRVA